MSELTQRLLLVRSPIQPVRLAAGLVLVTALLGACSPTISEFNARAYEQATELKVEALALMDKGTEPYADHASAVQQLQTELRKAHEFAQGRPNNEISARQWEILIDSNRDLLGGFFREWEKQSSFSKAFVEEKKTQIAQAFDTIIELESGKKKPEEIEGQ